MNQTHVCVQLRGPWQGNPHFKQIQEIINNVLKHLKDDVGIFFVATPGMGIWGLLNVLNYI